MQEYFHGTQQKLAPAELVKKDEPMPDVNASLNEGRGEAKNSYEEEVVQHRCSLRLLRKKLKTQGLVMGRTEL